MCTPTQLQIHQIACAHCIQHYVSLWVARVRLRTHQHLHALTSAHTHAQYLRGTRTPYTCTPRSAAVRNTPTWYRKARRHPDAQPSAQVTTDLAASNSRQWRSMQVCSPWSRARRKQLAPVGEGSRRRPGCVGHGAASSSTWLSAIGLQAAGRKNSKVVCRNFTNSKTYVLHRIPSWCLACHNEDRRRTKCCAASQRSRLA